MVTIWTAKIGDEILCKLTQVKFKLSLFRVYLLLPISKSLTRANLKLIFWRLKSDYSACFVFGMIFYCTAYSACRINLQFPDNARIKFHRVSISNYWWGSIQYTKFLDPISELVFKQSNKILWSRSRIDACSCNKYKSNSQIRVTRKLKL